MSAEEERAAKRLRLLAASRMAQDALTAAAAAAVDDMELTPEERARLEGALDVLGEVGEGAGAAVTPGTVFVTAWHPTLLALDTGTLVTAWRACRRLLLPAHLEAAIVDTLTQRTIRGARPAFEADVLETLAQSTRWLQEARPARSEAACAALVAATGAGAAPHEDLADLCAKRWVSLVDAAVTRLVVVSSRTHCKPPEQPSQEPLDAAAIRPFFGEASPPTTRELRAWSAALLLRGGHSAAARAQMEARVGGAACSLTRKELDPLLHAAVAAGDVSVLHALWLMWPADTLLIDLSSAAALAEQPRAVEWLVSKGLLQRHAEVSACMYGRTSMVDTKALVQPWDCVGAALLGGAVNWWTLSYGAAEAAMAAGFTPEPSLGLLRNGLINAFKHAPGVKFVRWLLAQRTWDNPDAWVAPAATAASLLPCAVELLVEHAPALAVAPKWVATAAVGGADLLAKARACAGCPWDARVTAAAAELAAVMDAEAALRALRAATPPCPWNDTVTTTLLSRARRTKDAGWWRILVWAYAKGCPVPPTLRKAGIPLDAVVTLVAAVAQPARSGGTA